MYVTHVFQIKEQSFRTLAGTTDMYSPFRVVDLRGYTIKENATAVLKFTAPGDDLFDGTGKLFWNFLTLYSVNFVLSHQTTTELSMEFIPRYIDYGNLPLF